MIDVQEVLDEDMIVILLAEVVVLGDIEVIAEVQEERDTV